MRIAWGRYYLSFAGLSLLGDGTKFRRFMTPEVGQLRVAETIGGACMLFITLCRDFQIMRGLILLR